MLTSTFHCIVVVNWALQLSFGNSAPPQRARGLILECDHFAFPVVVNLERKRARLSTSRFDPPEIGNLNDWTRLPVSAAPTSPTSCLISDSTCHGYHRRHSLRRSHGIDSMWSDAPRRRDAVSYGSRWGCIGFNMCSKTSHGLAGCLGKIGAARWESFEQFTLIALWFDEIR